MMRRLARPLAAALALTALACAQTAAAAPAPAPCLDRQELTAIVTYALPSAMDSAMTFCRPHLSPQGYLAREGRGLVQRYTVAKPAAWPQAKAALVKMAATGNDPTVSSMARLPDSALQPFAEGMVGQIVADGMKPQTCAPLEQAMRLLAPLPPENTAGLIAFVVTQTQGTRPGTRPTSRSRSSLPLCPVSS